METSPIRHTFPACCASTVSGAASRLPATLPRNVRRLIACPPRGRQQVEEPKRAARGDPTLANASVSAAIARLGLPAALALAVVRDLHLEPGQRAACTVGRRWVLGDQALVAALYDLRSRFQPVIREPARWQEDTGGC